MAQSKRTGSFLCAITEALSFRQTSPHIRQFSSSPVSCAAPRSDGLRPGSDLSKPLTREQAFDIADIPRYMFDDTTSAGHMEMERRRESLELLRAVERDRELLQRQRKPFVPPSSSTPLRFTRNLYVTDLPPSSPNASSSSSSSHTLPPSQAVKRVLQVPVQGLIEKGRLEGEVAIKRFKILAGARWTPDEAADLQLAGAKKAAGQDESAESNKGTGPRWDKKGKHGWIRMSEQAFPEGKMNRKWLSDALDRLIAEANNPSSPIAESTPIDTRHVVSRLQKQGKLLPGGKRRPTGLEAFPKEWL